MSAPPKTRVAIGSRTMAIKAVPFFTQLSDRELDVIRAVATEKSYAKNSVVLTEGEMGTFVKELRTRVLGDSQLGGESVDLVMGLAQAEQAVVASTKYAIVDTEIVLDFDEYTLAP